MFNLICKFFTDHKGVRRIKLLVMFGLGVFATLQVFLNMTEVSTGVAACYSTLIGACGFTGWKYMDSRGREDSRK